jgi:hypothetical protein
MGRVSRDSAERLAPARLLYQIGMSVKSLARFR